MNARLITKTGAIAYVDVAPFPNNPRIISKGEPRKLFTASDPGFAYFDRSGNGPFIDYHETNVVVK